MVRCLLLEDPGMLLRRPLASGLGVGLLGGVALGAALAIVARAADSLQSRQAVIVLFGFDVIAEGRGPDRAQYADRIAGEHLRPDLAPPGGQALSPVGALPAAAHTIRPVLS